MKDDYAEFEMLHTVTGMGLYKVIATESEIAAANERMSAAHCLARFAPVEAMPH